LAGFCICATSTNHHLFHTTSPRYSYTLEDAGEIIPKCPPLNNTVYESELSGGPFCLVFDSRKRLLHSTDIYPESVKCPKGVVTIKASSVLDRIRGQVVCSPVSMGKWCARPYPWASGVLARIHGLGAAVRGVVLEAWG
jgi:hypothetical protein